MSLDGGIDLLDRENLQGWVREREKPAEPVSLLLKIDGQVAGAAVANLYRSDLESAGIGDGRYGFAFKLEMMFPFEAHSVELVREGDEVPVPGMPRVIPPSPELNEALQAHLVDLLSRAATDETFKRWAAFLAQQVERLLQRRADTATNKPNLPVRREFRLRWSGDAPAPDRDAVPRALVIDERLPLASRDAGSRAVLSHMQSLQRLGFRVSLAPSDMKGGPVVDALEAEAITCYCAPWCASVEEVLRRERNGFALVYIHRGTNTRYLPLIRDYQPRARLIYSVGDLQHVRLARQAEVERCPELLEASKRVCAVEMAAIRFVDGVITHSNYEEAIIRRAVPTAQVHLVPWSVPLRPVTQPWAERHGFAYVGNFAHAPNLAAAWWLIHNVIPLIRAQNPSIGCILAGSDMPNPLRAVSAPGIQSIGFAESLDELYGRLRLTTAPLTFGAGLGGNVLESLSVGLPCACTPVAAEGLELPPVLQAIVGRDAQGLANVIVRLHDEEMFNAACGAAGLAYVAANMSDEKVDAGMKIAVGLASKSVFVRDQGSQQ